MSYIAGLIASIFVFTACGGRHAPPTAAERNEALGADGVERYCGLGQSIPDGEDQSAVVPRVSLMPDGRALIERVLVRRGHPPQAFAGQFAPGVDVATWRGPGAVRLKVERVNPRLALSERGLRGGTAPGWLKGRGGDGANLSLVRRAVRVRTVGLATGRAGPAQTLVPCATLTRELTEDLETAPTWSLDSSLAAFALRDRRAGAAPDADPAPRGWVQPGAPAGASKISRWCAFGFEFDSFRPNLLRVLTLADGHPRVRDYAFVDGRARARPGSAGPRVEAAEDQDQTPLLIEVTAADRSDGWFGDCADPRVRGLAAPFAGVAF